MILAASQSINPIIPSWSDVVWSLASFAVLVFLLVKFAFPQVARTMSTRSDRIRDDLKAAELARLESEAALAEYRAQLEGARRESTRLIEEARATADAIRDELISKANEDATAIRQRAEDGLAIERDRVAAELRLHFGEIAIDLAGRIVGSEIDRTGVDPLIRSFVAEIGS